MMKKILALLLSFAMLFSLAACEKEDIGMALDIAIAVLEELEKYENVQSDALPEYTGEGAESVEEIPPFSDVAYVAVNGNVPFFLPEEITDESYEEYAELDELGRCGVTMACIGVDIMPTEDRGDIGSVKPSGWHSVKYDIVEGKYLYNRCHLIGFQLAGENANRKNLITGTRYLNIEGMLPFENLVADYVQETENHVLYRVTPIFVEEEMVARGVLMEAVSVEDKGEGVEFCVYVYNNQPGILIDYATGESTLAPEEEETQNGEELTYILNTSSQKFHFADCGGVDTIKEENRSVFTGSRADVVAAGYEPCGRCKP